MKVKAVDHIVLNVADVEAAAAWYTRVLGMDRKAARSDDGAERTSLVFGPNKINLRPASASQDDWFTARTPTAGSDDLCFLIDAAPPEVVAHFRRCGVEVELGPVTKSGARGSICSVYVRDPDGNLIEVSSYE